MSLDVSLIVETPIKKRGTGVFIRENGKTKELTPDEVLDRYPGSEVTYTEHETNEVFSANITHNLNKMAGEATLYMVLWRPEEIDCVKAKDILTLLEIGLVTLLEDPDRFKKLNPENGYGRYEDLVEFVQSYKDACKKYPEAIIEVSR